MERRKLESRLHGSPPGKAQPPNWVRTRVLSRIESEAQQGSAGPPAWLLPGVLGAGALAAILIVLTLAPAPSPVPPPRPIMENPTQWASDEPVRVDLPRVENLRAIEPMSTEARRLEEDARQFASLVRIPLSKLHGVLVRN